MSAVPEVPLLTAAPVSAERLALLRTVTDGLEAPALMWLSGYLAGLAAGGTARGETPASRPEPSLQATVVYGTQTGNSRLIAERLHRQLTQSGIPARLLPAGRYPVRELAKERVLYVVISTQGEGDPPDDARGFYEFLTGKRAPKLPELRFSVLGLGDSSYAKYCETGRVLDQRLEELGAKRLLDRADCDVDFEVIAGGWVDGAYERAKEAWAALGEAPGAAARPVAALRALAPPPPRHQVHSAEVLVNQRITGRGATKDVRHLELSLEGSSLSYSPGDALSVRARNAPSLVDSVLDALKLSGAEPVTREDRTLPLSTWLTDELELTRLSRPVVARLAELSGSAELKAAIAPEGGEALRALLATHQVVDLLRSHPAAWTANELVSTLRKLAPRSYSLASSQKAVGDEAHLTVALVAYQAFGTEHRGCASAYLAERAAGERVMVSVEQNERFRLPDDPSRDIVMIGPGTGVAPFRGFVQERAAVGATGRSWLFFGEQHFRSQFLYQVEWQEALRNGTLTRISLAFSRDQAEKIYVQQRIRESGKELYTWLEGGAALYLCGDAKRMAPDVHAALLDVVTTHGGRSRDEAEEYLSQLREQRRYQRDIY